VLFGRVVLIVLVIVFVAWVVGGALTKIRRPPLE
jgi:hypothetical protein